MNLMHSHLLQNVKYTYERMYIGIYIFISLFMRALGQIIHQNDKVDDCNNGNNYNDCGNDNDVYYSDDSDNYNEDENGNGNGRFLGFGSICSAAHDWFTITSQQWSGVLPTNKIKAS